MEAATDPEAMATEIRRQVAATQAASPEQHNMLVLYAGLVGVRNDDRSVDQSSALQRFECIDCNGRSARCARSRREP